MENISPYEFIAAFGAISLVIISGVTFYFNHSLAKKSLNLQKKMRLLDFTYKLGNQYPTNHTDETYLRNLVYDFCDHKFGCMKILFICLNRPDSDISIQCFKISGHLFYLNNKTKLIIRKKGNRTLDIFKALLVFSYYALLMLSIWLMIKIAPRYLELDTRTQIYSYLIVLGAIIIFFTHSLLTLGQSGQRFRANRKLANILHIQDSDLPL